MCVNQSILLWCQIQVVELGLLHLVAVVGSTARHSAAGSTSGCSGSRSAQASGTDYQNVQCESRSYYKRVNDTQQLSQLESMTERQLPRGQEDILFPRVRELPGEQKSLRAIVIGTARERGALSRPGSLPERARITESARDR